MKTLPTRLRLVLASSFLAFAGVLHAKEKPAAESVPPSVLKRYDSNKDGALDEKERAKWEANKAAAREKDRKQREELLQKYDTNKDGKLNEEERAAAKLGMERIRTEQEGERMKERAAKLEKEASEAAAKEAGKAKEAEKAKQKAAEQKKGNAPENTMGGDTMMME